MGQGGLVVRYLLRGRSLRNLKPNHRRSFVHVGMAHAKSDVVDQILALMWCGSFGKGTPDQVSSTSSDLPLSIIPSSTSLLKATFSVFRGNRRIYKGEEKVETGKTRNICSRETDIIFRKPNNNGEIYVRNKP
ncbi:hypothetical protein AVEN_263240-1 [Araneus ventricosus]|uniref:Uncharacterized protein n=1 Tax=Araneus ventricosus TaxID=182803 RepID=A0A4Y2R4G7_ARAVE|nr:hypothetical protein AVEN_263240-1 [Araneus ventricosus]